MLYYADRSCATSHDGRLGSRCRLLIYLSDVCLSAAMVEEALISNVESHK